MEKENGNYYLVVGVKDFRIKVMPSRGYIEDLLG